MTTRHATKRRTTKLRTLSGALLGLCMAATSCASSDGTTSDDATSIDATSEAIPGDDDTTIAPLDDGGILDTDVPLQRSDQIDSDRPPLEAGGPQYGDTLDDLRDEDDPLAPPTGAIPGFDAVEWPDLIPPGFSSNEILARYEDRLAAVEPGSAELDEIYAEMNADYEDASVNPQLNSVDLQLAGFVAPLTYDGDEITEFLLVPYFGACIHVPPPPVNQTVVVSLGDGESLSLEESWGAVWVAGEMNVTSTETDLATAGYSITDARFEVYENGV